MSRSGFSYVEILISVMIVAIITLAIANFSSTIFKVSFDHSQQIEGVDQSRFMAEVITSEISKSDYIYPANKQISLSVEGKTTTINTDDSVAILVSANDDTPTHYFFKAFYLVKNTDKYDLYSFSSSTYLNWDKNTSPAINISSVSGSASLIASDIDKESSTLDYILCNSNGITDSTLKGNISSVLDTDQNALIKGVEWNLVLSKNSDQTVQIKGVSQNVPRFIE